LPLLTPLAENSRPEKKLNRPVVSRLVCIRSNEAEDATAFGPRTHVNARAA
jgi:hypothetical protein